LGSTVNCLTVLASSDAALAAFGGSAPVTF
jgi:hypothetical protein